MRTNSVNLPPSADRFPHLVDASGGEALADRGEVHAMAAALRTIAANLAEILASLSAVRSSLALTINCLFEGGQLSSQYHGMEKLIVDRNLEFRLDVAEACEHMAAESLSLQDIVASWRQYIDELVGGFAGAEEFVPNDDFRLLLRKLEARCGHIHQSFNLLLAKFLFVKMALEFSNYLLGLGQAGEKPRPTLSGSPILTVIDEVKKFSAKPESVTLERIVDQFANAQRVALASAEGRSARSFDEALAECEGLTRVFMNAASAQLAKVSP